MSKDITIYDMTDLVKVTVKDLVASGVKISVSPMGVNEIQIIVDGKECIFTLSELMEQKNSVRGFINLIKGRIR